MSTQMLTVLGLRGFFSLKTRVHIYPIRPLVLSLEPSKNLLKWVIWLPSYHDDCHNEFLAENVF